MVEPIQIPLREQWNISSSMLHLARMQLQTQQVSAQLLLIMQLLSPQNRDERLDWLLIELKDSMTG